MATATPSDQVNFGVGAAPLNQVRALTRIVAQLTAAQILALQTGAITLVNAPGAGKAIVPVEISMFFTGGSAAFTDAGGAVSFKVGATVAKALANNNIFLVTVSPNRRIQTVYWADAIDTAGNPSDSENQPLTISKITNNFAAGNGTMIVEILYFVQNTTPSN